MVRSTIMDKWWHWGTGYKPTDEDDNILSFRLEKADAETGATFGTLVNTPGPNGLYANYMYGNTTDMNGSYRIFPAGKSRWGKSGKGGIDVYAFEDADYATPLYTVNVVEGGDQTYDGASFNIPEMAFSRSFAGPFNNVVDWNDDGRWYTLNLRHVFWLVRQDSEEPLANHSDLIAE